MTIDHIQQADVPVLMSLMKEFAVYDGSEEELILDEERLTSALFSTAPSIYCVVAKVADDIVGFLNYQFTFSSFQLKQCLWVEDVFVNDDHRGKGIGLALFKKVKEIAMSRKCGHLEWLVRRDNHLGKRFYNRLGAKVDDSTIYVKWALDTQCSK